MQRWNKQFNSPLGPLHIGLSAVAVALYAIVSPALGTDEFTLNEFQELHQQLQVATDKPWRTIPWKTSVLDAQQTAAQQAKPIFIWAMDGHPLGCT